MTANFQCYFSAEISRAVQIFKISDRIE